MTLLYLYRLFSVEYINIHQKQQICISSDSNDKNAYESGPTLKYFNIISFLGKIHAVKTINYQQLWVTTDCEYCRFFSCNVL